MARLRKIGDMRLVGVTPSYDGDGAINETFLTYHLVLDEAIREQYHESQESWYFEPSLTRAMCQYRADVTNEAKMPIVARLTEEMLASDAKQFEDHTVFPEVFLLVLHRLARQIGNAGEETVFLVPAERRADGGKKGVVFRATSTVELTVWVNGGVDDAERFTRALARKLNRWMRQTTSAAT